MQKPVKTLVSLAIASLVMTTATHAGSFSLYTESRGAAVGNYAAGVAAEAADASTGWYNPAGLSLIHNQQMVVGGVGVFPNSELTGSSTFRTSGLGDYTQSFNDLEGAKNAFVPSFHFAYPLGQNVTAGLSIVSPFGLSTEWSAQGPVRYAATHSELLTMNVSPELGGKITDNLAIGGGIDFQYSKVKFNQVLGAPSYLQELQEAGLPTFPNGFDSSSYNRGDSFGVGFHAGLLFMFNNNHTRVGMNYQSEIRQQYHGYSRLTGPLATPGLDIADVDSIVGANTNAVFKNNSLSSNDIDFPDIVTLSAYQDINDQLALLGSVVYTGWKSFSTIQLNGVAAFEPTLGQVTVNSVSEELYRNVWRFAVGANYKVNERVMVRFGGGYDQTPTTDAHRDIRIADSNRWALSVGSRYQARSNIAVDVGYTHLFSTGEVPVNTTQFAGTGSTYSVNAQAKGSADLVGGQVTWLMDGVDPVVTK